MIEQLSQIDTHIFTYLNNLGNPTWDSFWLLFTEKRSHIPLMLVLIYLLFKHLSLKKFILSLIIISAMAAFTDQITNLAKHFFKRPRPCLVPDLEASIRYIAKRCSKYSFFSGHSSNSMAIATLLGLLLKPKFPKALFLLLIWAFMMGYSRIYVGVHYPGDVLTGFSVGILSGLIFYKLYLFTINKFNIS